MAKTTRPAAGRRIIQWAAALAVSMAAFSAQAAWPEKAIQWVVTFAPGGGTDVVARVVTKYLSEELGVPVNVTNMAGGNQIPGIMHVLNSRPDGYVLLQEQQANSAIKVILKDLPFKLEDRTYGPLLVSGPNALVVNGKSGWNSLKDMVAFAKATPEKFSYARIGGTSFTDMINLVLFESTGIDVSKVKAVDFPGVGPANVAVAGGHVMLGGGGAGSVVSLVQSGDLKALAVSGDQRVGVLPNTPSAVEAGFPDLYLVNWYGVSGPVGLPKEVMDRLSAAMKKISAKPEFVADLEKIASVPFYKSPEESRAFVLKEAQLYRDLAAKYGL